MLSKLANILWTTELQKRLDAEGTPIIAISVNPGAVNTFADRLPRFRSLAKFLMGIFFKTWDQGAHNSTFSAASPLIREHPEIYRGAYIEGNYGKVGTPSKNARDADVAADLWKTTQGFVESIGLA